MADMPLSALTAVHRPLQKWAPSGRMLVDDRFGLEKFTEGNLSPFTSISRHLVASERGLRIFRRAINKHHPRLKSGGHVIRAFLACRLHIGGQAVNGVIGDADRVIDIFISNHTKNRSEDLLACDRHLVRHVRENGGLDIVACLKSVGMTGAAEK